MAVVLGIWRRCGCEYSNPCPIYEVGRIAAMGSAVYPPQVGVTLQPTQSSEERSSLRRCWSTSPAYSGVRVRFQPTQTSEEQSSLRRRRNTTPAYSGVGGTLQPTQSSEEQSDLLRRLLLFIIASYAAELDTSYRAT